jgi:SpoVK/Ycf46/Vps4 family AAA+-type ATPase
MYSDIGGLSEQIRELRETIELPLTNPDLFVRVGIKPPKGVLLYGPPGTGKTLLVTSIILLYPLTLFALLKHVMLPCLTCIFLLGPGIG